MRIEFFDRRGLRAERHIALARQRHRSIGRGIGIGIAAKRGARLVDRDDAFRRIARKDRLLRLRIRLGASKSFFNFDSARK